MEISKLIEEREEALNNINEVLQEYGLDTIDYFSSREDFDRHVDTQIATKKLGEDVEDGLTNDIDDVDVEKVYNITSFENLVGDDWEDTVFMDEDDFKTYQTELIDELKIPSWVTIDYDSTISDLKHDWSTVEYDGTDYYYQ